MVEAQQNVQRDGLLRDPTFTREHINRHPNQTWCAKGRGRRTFGSILGLNYCVLLCITMYYYVLPCITMYYYMILCITTWYV